MTTNHQQAPRGQRGFSPLPRGQRGFSPLTRGQRGFSLVEGLIGAALLLVVVLGVLPLFTRAIIDNSVGADYTRVTNISKSRAEDFNRAPFNGGAYVIQAGTTKTVIDEYLDPKTNTWVPIVPPITGTVPAPAQWRRTTTLTQYLFDDAVDADGMLDTPVDGNTQGNVVMQAEVVVKNAVTNGPMGGRRQTTIRYFKAF